MFNFKIMENTNEREEMDALDSVGNSTIEPSEGTCGAGKAGEQGASGEDRGTDDHEGVSDETSDGPIGVNDESIELLKRYPNVCARIAELMRTRAEAIALELIEKGIGYDVAVADADKNGYVRGRNEKIELAKRHRMPQLDAVGEQSDADVSGVGLFPRYVKRDFWED
jgi:hypothetical protein